MEKKGPWAYSDHFLKSPSPWYSGHPERMVSFAKIPEKWKNAARLLLVEGNHQQDQNFCASWSFFFVSQIWSFEDPKVQIKFQMFSLKIQNCSCSDGLWGGKVHKSWFPPNPMLWRLRAALTNAAQSRHPVSCDIINPPCQEAFLPMSSLAFSLDWAFN